MSGTDELAVDFAGPDTVTEWRARPVDAQGQSAGTAYTLHHRKQDGNAALNDASGPGAGSTAGTRKVLALTSAEALAVAWNDWGLRQQLGPGERDVVLAASAREDRHDVSTSCQRVAGAPDPGIARPREPSRDAGRER